MPTCPDPRSETVDQQSFDAYRADETTRVAPSQPLFPAILAGLGAALVGGIAWTVIMAVTGYEIGYAAWGSEAW